MSTLRYRSFVAVEDLALGECTIHRVAGGWWHVWIYVNRDLDGLPDTFCVPVIPNGSYTETGPGGRSWGLTRSGSNTWQLAPSINVVQAEDAKRIQAGAHPTLPSLWHQTPALIDVPDGEAWQR